MKIRYLILIAVVVAAGWNCTKTPEYEEFVLSRFPDGSPKEIRLHKVNETESVKIIEKLYYPNGQVERERALDNGLPNGLWKEWFKNGQVRLIKTYKRGDIHGKQEGWYPTGEKYFTAEFENGVLLSRTEWNKDGTVKRRKSGLNEE